LKIGLTSRKTFPELINYRNPINITFLYIKFSTPNTEANLLEKTFPELINYRNPNNGTFLYIYNVQ